MKLTGLLKGLGWQDLMVPIGAALLAAGARHLEDRAEAAERGLEILTSRVEFRHAQLDGREHLCTPAPEPVDQADAAPEPIGKSGQWAAVAAVAVIGVAAWRWIGRPLACSLLDQLDDRAVFAEEPATPQPDPHSGVRVDVGQLVDEQQEAAETPEPADMCEDQDESEAK